jgi:hypothetical protein
VAAEKAVDPFNRDERFRDFRVFLCHVWRHVIGKDPSPLQYEYGWRLQHGGVKLFLAAYRGFGKSFIAVAYAVWILYWNPNKKIVLVSASQGFAKDLSTFAFQIIRGVPGMAFLDCVGRERHSKISFDVGPAVPDKQPSVVALGIGGQITGNRADVIIADDVEVPNNSDTQAAREKLGLAIQEFAAVIKPRGQIVYLGTPQNESSIYTLLPERGYKVVLWPIQYPDEQLAAVQKTQLAPSILEALANDASPGDPTDPARFDALSIAERRGEYGATGFALQFQLNTALANVDRYPLKLRDLVITDCSGPTGPESFQWTGAPQQELRDLEARGLGGDRFFGPLLPDKVRYSPWQGVAMFVDPSGTGKDETAYAIVKHLNGNLFLAEQVGLRGGYTDAVMVAIAEAAKRHQVNRIVDESNFGDGMFGRLLQPHLARIYPCSVEELRVSGQKELRILDTLEPVVQQHRLAVDRTVFERDNHRSGTLPELQARRYTLAHQFTRITREKGCLAHDDRIDSLAGAVSLWVESMAKNVDKEKERADRRQEEKDLRDFVSGTMDWAHPDRGRGGLRHNRAIGLRRGSPSR